MCDVKYSLGTPSPHILSILNINFTQHIPVSVTKIINLIVISRV